jgi:hypothetical protein
MHVLSSEMHWWAHNLAGSLLPGRFNDSFELCFMFVCVLFVVCLFNVGALSDTSKLSQAFQIQSTQTLQ